MGSTDQWAGGPDDRERKRLKLQNALDAADFWLSDDSWDGPRTKIDEVNDSAGVWLRSAERHGFEYRDPRSDAEALALPHWGELITRLRALGLPVHRVRSLARGSDDGTAFENLCVCDADEAGNIIPVRIWVLRLNRSLPDLACEAAFADAPPAPRSDLWGVDLSRLRTGTAVRERDNAVKAGRFGGSRLGKAVLGKLNDFLDNTRWTRVYADDPDFAQAVAERFVNDRALWDHNGHWMVRGPLLVYITPELDKGVPHPKVDNPLLAFLTSARDAVAELSGP